MENTQTFNDLVKGVNADFAGVFDENQYAYKPFVGSIGPDGQAEKPSLPLFDTMTTSQAEDHFTSVSSINDLRPTSENQGINYQTRILGYRKDIYQQFYTAGIQVSYKEMKFGGYRDKLDEMKSMTMSGQRTKDKAGFLGIYAASATAGFGAGDGLSLANASHTRADGGAVQSNILTGTTYGETTQEQAIQLLAAYYDNKGNLITASGQKVILLVPEALKKIAQITNNGEYRPGTNNNDINVYDGVIDVVATSLIGAKSSFEFANGTTITGNDTDVHFIDPGVFKPKFMIGQDLTYDKTIDFDTKVSKFSVVSFFSFAPIDWRGYVRMSQ